MAIPPTMMQGVIPQTLLNSFTAGNAPQGGIAVTGTMPPRTMGAPAAADTGAQAPATLAEMTRLLGGDLSGSLSSGDKLLALSGLLRSATRSGRRAGLTPQQVIGDIRQQKLAELQNRMAVEQLRMAQEQRQQQLKMVNEYANAIADPKQRSALLALGPEKAAEKMAEVAFRQRQVQQILTDEDGKSRIVFGDGSEGTLSFNVERGAKWIKGDPMNTGTQVLVKVDEKTGEPILEDGKFQTMAIGASWADQQRIAQGWENTAIARARAARGGGGGGGGGRKRNAPAVIYDAQGRKVLAEFDPNSRKYYVPNTTTEIKRGVGPAEYN